jgi:hypothetical protein
MPMSYLTFFSLNNDFTILDLEKSYENKKKAIGESSNLSEADKEYFLENIQLLYKQAKQDYHRRELTNMNNTRTRNLIPRYRSLFDNFLDFPSMPDEWLSFRGFEIPSQQSQSTFSSSSSSYRERFLPDGSRIVINENTTNNNGEITKNTNSYRRLANGSTEPINYDDALKAINQQKELRELL